MKKSVIDVYSKFFEYCEHKHIKWYITETMTRYKKVTNRTFSLFPQWLTAPEKQKNEYHIHLKNGEEYSGTPDYGVWLYGIEEGAADYGMSTSMIRFTFPADFGRARTEEMFTLACYVCNQLDIASGLVGYCIEKSDFFQQQSHLAAWQLSMQHRGLDVANELRDSIGVGHDGIKGVNWLTMLSPEFVDRLGGVERIQAALPGTTTTRTKSALLIRACTNPMIGGTARDDTIAPYKSVYRVVSPLLAPIFNRYGAFDLPGGDHIAKTRAWLTRLADD